MQLNRRSPAFMEAKLRINVFSESEFTVSGHGVHSAFLEHVRYLADRNDVELVVNGGVRCLADILHLHTIGPYAATRLLTATGAKVASAHVVPESLVGSLVGGRQVLRPASCYLSWFYNCADLVIAVSEYTKQELLRIGVRTPIALLPNCISPDELQAAHTRRHATRHELGIEPSETLAISVGQLQPRKGVEEFLCIARRLPYVKFLWAGEAIFGAVSLQRTELRRAITQAPPNVAHAGQVTRQRVFDLLTAADIYISLSKQETFGIATLEAATAALPLVLSGLPAFRDVYGTAAQYATHETAVQTIAGLAASEPMRYVWGARAADVAAKYRWDTNGESLLRLYRQLIGSC